MAKKISVNSNAEAGKARKSMVESECKEHEALKKKEQYWREVEGGNKSRALKKKEDEAERRAEASARKAETRRLAELEEKELENVMKKVDKRATRVPKVTEAELRKWREEEEEEAAKQKRHTRTAAEEEYERMVLVKNTNRDDSTIDARTVEDAIAYMTVAYNLPVDSHRQRRLKPRSRECFNR